MKKIPKSVYVNLKPSQRVIACIEADAKGDEDEKGRLLDACPSYTYVLRELEFTQKIGDLFGLATAIECDLRGCVLGYFYLKPKNPLAASDSLQNFANIREAWELALSEFGIDLNSMRIAGPPMSPVFALIEDLLPDPDHDTVENIAAEYRNFLFNA